MTTTQETLSQSKIDSHARMCAKDAIANGWTGGGADYNIGIYTGDRESLEDELGRALERSEVLDLERAIRSELDRLA